ncbi:hypothetical protein LZ31DRAFT_65610 [Colletotrichum somersetense]|nr:hypothetical protein LZ31DRAFT_65610 [Colletotrichum somersetense]
MKLGTFGNRSVWFCRAVVSQVRRGWGGERKESMKDPAIGGLQLGRVGGLINLLKHTQDARDKRQAGSNSIFLAAGTSRLFSSSVVLFSLLLAYLGRWVGEVGAHLGIVSACLLPRQSTMVHTRAVLNMGTYESIWEQRISTATQTHAWVYLPLLPRIK